METKKIMDAIKERYGDMDTLRLAMSECEDTVLVNLAYDTSIEEDIILTTILKLLRDYRYENK
jgi:hypothetical protein